MTPGAVARIDVAVALGAPLGDLAEAASLVAAEVEAGVDRVGAALGLPATVHATVATVPDDRPLALRVGSAPCRHSLAVEQAALLYSRRVRGDADPAAEAPDWAAELGAGREAAAATIGRLAEAAVANAPGLLLTPSVVDAACRNAGLAPSELAPTLHALVRAGVAVPAAERLRDVLAASGSASPDDRAEDALAALRPSRLEVRAAPAFLERVTTAYGEAGPDLFEYLHESMHDELGLRLPELSLRPDGALAPDCFRIRVNDLDAPPVAGLRAECLLVNDSAPRVELMGLSARFGLNVGGSAAFAVVDESSSDLLAAVGLTSWNCLQHVVFCLAETIRERAAALVDRTAVDHELQLLEQIHPQTTRAARELVPQPRITRLLRALVAERVPVKDLGGLLQPLLDHAAEGDLPADDGALLALARRGLRPSITARAARGRPVLVAYLLDPELEEAVGDAGAADALIEAVEAEVAELPASVEPPALLTTAAARPGLRALVAATFPRMAVVSYDEVEPMANVQPIARIALPSATAAPG